MAKFEVEVLVEINLDGDSDDAHRQVDAIMQANWDSWHHAGMASQIPTEWHFSILEGAVAEIDEES